MAYFESNLIPDPLSVNDRKAPIQSVLSRWVSQEGYDDEMDNIIQKASEYISFLEKELDRLNAQKATDISGI